MRTTDIFPLGAVALVAAAILTVIACIRQKRTVGQGLRLFIVRFGGLWYALVAVTLLFKLSTLQFAIGMKINGASVLRANFVPFATIAEYAAARNVIQIAGNLGVLLPLPILLRFNFPKMSFRRAAVISAIITVMIEPLQLLVNVMIRSPYNSIDIDDLILNAVGTTVGLAITKLIMAVSAKTRRASV